MRVLVTGMGGELGTRVAMLLEGERSVDAIAGLDLDPPRRRLRQTDFFRIEPRDRKRTVEAVRAFAPTAVVHLGVYEPDARSTPRAAAEQTSAAAVAVLGAAAELDSLEAVVVRSGIEVYSRRRGSVTVPDEDVAPDPGSAFGHSLLQVEAVAASAGERADVPVTVLRMAPIVGPHFPSPLGRYLRLPLVPVSLLSDPTFSVLHQEDAARAVVHALLHRRPGAFNIVGAGAVTALQATRLGNRVPVPLVGPGWLVARRIAEVLGSPVPGHLAELLVRGRTADGSRATSELGYEPAFSTPEVVRDLYEWAPVTHLRPATAAA
jgi:UDP-glucose 4-epimerase